MMKKKKKDAETNKSNQIKRDLLSCLFGVLAELHPFFFLYLLLDLIQQKTCQIIELLLLLIKHLEEITLHHRDCYDTVRLTDVCCALHCQFNHLWNPVPHLLRGLQNLSLAAL